MSEESVFHRIFKDLFDRVHLMTQDYFDEEYLKFSEELQSKDNTVRFIEQGLLFKNLIGGMAEDRNKTIPKTTVNTTHVVDYDHPYTDAKMETQNEYLGRSND